MILGVQRYEYLSTPKIRRKWDGYERMPILGKQETCHSPNEGLWHVHFINRYKLPRAWNMFRTSVARDRLPT